MSGDKDVAAGPELGGGWEQLDWKDSWLLFDLATRRDARRSDIFE